MNEKRTIEKLQDILLEAEFTNKEEALKFCGWLVAEPVDKLKIIHATKDRMEKDYIERLGMRDKAITSLSKKLENAIIVIRELEAIIKSNGDKECQENH